MSGGGVDTQRLSLFEVVFGHTSKADELSQKMSKKV